VSQQKEELDAALGRTALEEIDRNAAAEMWRNPPLDEHGPSAAAVAAAASSAAASFHDLGSSNNFNQHRFPNTAVGGVGASGQQHPSHQIGAAVQVNHWHRHRPCGSP
jgi:hypothetical protein